MIFEIPVAFASLIFYKAARGVLRNYARFSSRKAPANGGWRVLDAAFLQKKLSLPMVMTQAPRWNPHAIIGSTGPLKVRRSLSVHTATADRSAAIWTIVVYALPARKTVTRFDSRDDSRGEWQTAKLESGNYQLISRYYHWGEEPELPALEIDEQTSVKARSIDITVNDFYQHLPRRRSLFYLCLHIHIITLLRLRNWLPKPFVHRAFAPVGNPETKLIYGVLEAGHVLQFNLETRVLADHDIFYTVYGRDSFPVEWGKVDARKYLTSIHPRTGYYLVRVLKRKEGAVGFDEASLGLTVHREVGK